MISVACHECITSEYAEVWMRFILIEKSSLVILLYRCFGSKSHTLHVLCVPDCFVVDNCSCACFFLVPASSRACNSNDELQLLKSTSVGVSAGVKPLEMNEERSVSLLSAEAALQSSLISVPSLGCAGALDRLKYSCSARNLRCCIMSCYYRSLWFCQVRHVPGSTLLSKNTDLTQSLPLNLPIIYS